MKVLETREDIILLINTFYEKVKKDETIGFIFNDIARVDWPAHMPIMYDFWETTLLGKQSYQGNPMVIHQKLNEKVKLTPAHFKRWEELFHKTLDELFIGESAEMAKQRATSIKTVMELKICY